MKNMARHSGMEAGIQRPRMASYNFSETMNQAFMQSASYRPWLWIPAIPAEMTAFVAN